MDNVVLMLHGYKGTWNNGWFATIQSRLTELQIPFISPSLPKPETPDYNLWKNEITKIINEQLYSSENKKHITIIAHSLACFAILRMIDEIFTTNEIQSDNLSIFNNSIKCIIMVAPIVSYHQKFPQFTDHHFSFIYKNNINQLKITPITTYLIYSTDDNYVDKEVIHNFISHFKTINQKEKEFSIDESKVLDLIYIEKNGFMHFMQDDLPFVTDLVTQVCTK